MPPTLEGLTCPICQQGELEVLDELLQCPACNWSMWREVGHRRLKDAEIVAIVGDGKTKLLSGFRSKAGKEFAASLVLTDDGQVQFQFPPRPEFDHTPRGKCPLCGAEVIEREKSYSCSAWMETHCGFGIWKETAGHTVTREEAMRLLTGETLGPFAMRSRQGKRFRARLVLDREEGKVQFEFVDGRPAHDADETA